MSPPVTLGASNDRSELRSVDRRRVGRLAAYLAAPLWASQMVIGTVAPKVQEATAPFAITNPVLFALFWLSIAGAVAFSAASAADVPRTIQGLTSRVSWWASALATIAGCLASAATIAIVAALIPAVQGAAISIMTNMLNGPWGSWLGVSASLRLGAGESTAPQDRHTFFPQLWQRQPPPGSWPSSQSGTHSIVGLYFAVAVAALNGIVWFFWGRASSVHGPR